MCSSDLSLIISITLAILASSTVMAQTSIPSAKWSKATSFKQCVAGTCETFKNIELNLDAIEVGQIISIINLDDGVEISSFEVKSIMHSREVNIDRKSTRLNSSHKPISYAVFCLKKKHGAVTRRLASGFAWLRAGTFGSNSCI